MSLEIKIEMGKLNRIYKNCDPLKLEGDAFFFFPKIDKYKPIYTIFTSENYDSVEDDGNVLVWERDPFSEVDKYVLPHKMTIGNHDQLTFGCRDANINYFHMDSYRHWRDWFLRGDTKMPCTIHYIQHEKFVRGDEALLKECGVEIVDGITVLGRK